MNKITASDTILELREVFSTLGLPEIIVTDNSPTFTSSDFCSFMSHIGIKHITVSPYHPSSNGLAERSVQTFKKAMIKTNTHGIVRRHQDQVRISVASSSDTTDEPLVENERLEPQRQNVFEPQSFQSPISKDSANELPVVEMPNQAMSQAEQGGESPCEQNLSEPCRVAASEMPYKGFEPICTRSGRVVKPPDRLTT
ncbi:Pol polyprotein [Elysia marginata]|uniref:Pol polyprotein n=1 Tax=Elysia marginata TaxID=1093978 RepID=A0AAV4HY23_9GAST|nr:Pol polyprotein [Elysia marginata]